jgi:parallel beta-helix repeat protein
VLFGVAEEKRRILVIRRKMFSATIIALLLTSMLVPVFNVQSLEASGTIYIRADGSIDPPTVPIERNGNTYTLTGDITDSSICVERNDIVLDGAGHALRGPGESIPASYATGINLTQASNVVIKNVGITKFVYGIQLANSSNITIIGNYITENGYTGIQGSTGGGVMLGYSSNNLLVENDIRNNTQGILLGFSSHNHITGNNIAANNLPAQGIVGIGIFLIGPSSSNIIAFNNITDGLTAGIAAWSLTPDGMHVGAGNPPTDNDVSGNNISRNGYGIVFVNATANKAYHNNFVDNTLAQAYSLNSTDIWDDGYPSGGNYWDNYAGVDLYSGPYQNETGSDGIGDTPYTIPSTDGGNIDNYPLMPPWGQALIHDVAVMNIVSSYTHVTVGESFSVYVTVRNLGTQTEMFSVTAYFGSGKIGFDTETVTLDAGETRTLNMIWDTTGVTPNSYQIGAYASQVPGETNLANNDYPDGTVVIEGLPCRPESLVAKPMISSVNLTWTAPSKPNVQRYYIFRGTTPDFEIPWPDYHDTVDGSTLQFTDSVSEDIIYYYKVVASFSEGFSIPSESVGCARLESLKGIANTVINAHTLSVSEWFYYVTIQQNFFICTGTHDKNGNPVVYWCQNVVCQGMNGFYLLAQSDLIFLVPYR